jgi:hypothetical protein
MSDETEDTMNKENTEYLIKTFPNLYRGVDRPLTASLMGFGFECGDGWFELIKELSAKLEAAGAEAMQVKEKFGGLRFYLAGGASHEVWDLIEEAELRSESICEECGDPGETRELSWVRTLCSCCFDNREI